MSTNNNVLYKNNFINEKQKKELCKLANHFDKIGLYKEASYVDAILKKQAFLDFNNPIINELVGAGIDNLQNAAVKVILEHLGAEDKSFASDLTANIFENLDVTEIMQMMTMSEDELCRKISLEVASAFQKTLLEVNVTDKVEGVLEDAINTLMGFSPGGAGSDFVKLTVNDAFAKSVSETITTYFTENNVISIEISNFICSAVKALVGKLVLNNPQFGEVLGIGLDRAKELAETPVLGDFLETVSEGFEEGLESGKDILGGLGEDAIEFVKAELMPGIIEDIKDMAEAEKEKFLKEMDTEIKEEFKKQAKEILKQEGAKALKEYLGEDAYNLAKSLNLF